MTSDPENIIPRYDVIVVGAGPGGAEAALAATGAGARTLCLTINLDSTGYHPANPTIVDGPDDPCGELLAEMELLGCKLPLLLAEEHVSKTDDLERLVVDRRLLGLAYKRELESTDGLELRQALVSNMDDMKDHILLDTALGESFSTGAVVVAGGTFFQAEVTSGDLNTPGGRTGEIPSISLSKCLQNKGIRFERITATASPRLFRHPSLSAGFSGSRLADLPEDGSQLCEHYGIGEEQLGNGEEQLARLRDSSGTNDAWITRPSYSVSHLALSANQISTALESIVWRGCFFAGRLAGCCNYLEAAASGFVAGTNAASSAGTTDSFHLTNRHIFVSKIVELLSESYHRPVTIRVPGPGC